MSPCGYDQLGPTDWCDPLEPACSSDSSLLTLSISCFQEGGLKDGDDEKKDEFDWDVPLVLESTLICPKEAG